MPVIEHSSASLWGGEETYRAVNALAGDIGARAAYAVAGGAVGVVSDDDDAGRPGPTCRRVLKAHPEAGLVMLESEPKGAQAGASQA